MDRSFRILSLKQIKQAGLINDYVQSVVNKYTKSYKPIEKTEFVKKFESMPSGPAREQLVYDEVIKRGKPKNLKPVIAKDENSGTEITYFVMPDFINIDGLYLPMTGPTAQKIADAWGMHLPTSKMSRQIYNNAGGKIHPAAMSAGGEIGGKQYSAQAVVDKMINNSQTSVAYSNRIAQEKAKANSDFLAGHMKDIVQPGLAKDRLYMQGMYDKDGKAIQGTSEKEESARTLHNRDHSEYTSGLRLVGNKIVVKENGQEKQMTMEEALKHPKYSKILSHLPGVRKY